MLRKFGGLYICVKVTAEWWLRGSNCSQSLFYFLCLFFEKSHVILIVSFQENVGLIIVKSTLSVEGIVYM